MYNDFDRMALEIDGLSSNDEKTRRTSKTSTTTSAKSKSKTSKTKSSTKDKLDGTLSLGKFYARLQQEPKSLIDRTSTTRNPFERDSARIGLSSAYRKLYGKKTHSNPFLEGHSRIQQSTLTGSIAVSIMREIHAKSSFSSKKDFSLEERVKLLETASKAINIGTTPLGNITEKVLNTILLMETDGKYGFSTNNLTFMLLNEVETKNVNLVGLNLTRGVLISLLRYPLKTEQLEFSLTSQYNMVLKNNLSYDDIKSGRGLIESQPYSLHTFYEDSKEFFNVFSEDLEDWEFNNFINYLTQSEQRVSENIKIYEQSSKLLECSILYIANDISHLAHTIEYSMFGGFVRLSELIEFLKARSKTADANLEQFIKKLETIDRSKNSLSSIESHNTEVISLIINQLINSVVSVETSGSDTLVKEYLEVVNRKIDKTLRYSFVHYVEQDDSGRTLYALLNEFVNSKIVNTKEIKRLEFKTYHIITSLYQACKTSPKVMDAKFYNLLSVDENDAKVVNDAYDHKLIAAFIASLSDDDAISLYKELCVV